jgi:uncharacterized membrane protein YhaH (DUF805 family)
LATKGVDTNALKSLEKWKTATMNFSTAIITVLKKYAVFSGRASRPEFWYWILAVALVSFVFAIIEGALLAPALGFKAFDPEAGQPLSVILDLAIFLPSIAVAVRRLHDTGRSGWWFVLQLIPLIGTLVLLWWFVQPGLEEPNEYD